MTRLWLPEERDCHLQLRWQAAIKETEHGSRRQERSSTADQRDARLVCGPALPGLHVKSVWLRTSTIHPVIEKPAPPPLCGRRCARWHSRRPPTPSIADRRAVFGEAGLVPPRGKPASHSTAPPGVVTALGHPEDPLLRVQWAIIPGHSVRPGRGEESAGPRTEGPLKSAGIWLLPSTSGLNANYLDGSDGRPVHGDSPPAQAMGGTCGTSPPLQQLVYTVALPEPGGC